MALRISKDITDTLDELKKLHAVREFNDDYYDDDDNDTYAEYEAKSAEMTKVFGPLVMELCQAGLIRVHAFIDGIVSPLPNGQKCFAVEGCPKRADYYEESDFDGCDDTKISLYLYQESAAAYMRRYSPVPKVDEVKEAAIATIGQVVN
jgi:hypothetical protein